MDEGWVVERALAGKFEELRAVKAESDKGSPVAMLWWGHFVNLCVYDPCDPRGARELWTRAAQAGNSDAKALVIALARSGGELKELIEKIGAPATANEKLAYAVVLFGLVRPGERDDEAARRAFADLQEVAATEPRLNVILGTSVIGGLLKHKEEWRAIVEAGYYRASEQFLRMLTLERVAYPERLARARAGDLTIGAALCQTYYVTTGAQKLPPDLLPVCERGLMEGHLGIAPVLLQHHDESGNAKAAAFYADLCARLAVHCATELAEHYERTSGKSPSWALWDAVAGMTPGVPATMTNTPVALRQQVFSARLRVILADRACEASLLDRATGRFKLDPACPFRRPVAIPPEFLSAGSGTGKG